MRAIQMKSSWGAVAATALLATYGCGTPPNATQAATAAQAVNAQAGSPVVVSCEPNQRTLVRPVVVNGATISQVECVSVDGLAPAYAPVSAGTARAVPAAYYQPVYEPDLAPARVVPVRTQTAARPVRTRQVIYDEPVRAKRSVKKSAVIIGSSAAVGAGVGAVTGGKKGALIGAAIGGGGAAIWDQITRRR
jgi:hypothetical protein